MRSYLKFLAAVLSVSMIGGCADKSSDESSQTTSTSSQTEISSAAPDVSSTPGSETPLVQPPQTPDNWQDFTASDGLPVSLADGYVDDYDLEGIIERGKAAAVTLTLDDIRLQYANLNHGGRGGVNFAKIVDVKPR